MDIYNLIGQLLVISCIPLIHYALTKKMNLKDIKKARWQYVFVFTFVSFSSFVGSSDVGSSFFAILISLIIYVVTYRLLRKNKYSPRIADFETIEEYISALAGKKGIKYPLSQNVTLIHGAAPKMEDFETVPDWVNALKKYFEDIESV